MTFERATNPSLGNFAAVQGGRWQSSRPHWRQPRVCLRGLMQMTIAAVFATTFAMPVWAQDFPTGSGAPAAAFPNPDRAIADIISPIWHDEKERDDANEPRQLVRLLGIRSGMTVADIGAGSGYYVVRLSPIVGPGGRIIAEDVVPEYLQSLRSRVRALGLQNVVISLGESHDPRLPADSLDTAILVHMYTRSLSPMACSIISFRRLNTAREWALWMPMRRRRSMAPRQAFYDVNLQPQDTAKSVSIGLRAATHISRSSRHLLLRAALGRKLWSPARRRSRLPTASTRCLQFSHRPFASAIGMSALCQKRTKCSTAKRWAIAFTARSLGCRARGRHVLHKVSQSIRIKGLA